MKVVRITDKPTRRINTGNYEQRLRKLLTVIRLMAGELEEGLAQIEREKKATAHV